MPDALIEILKKKGPCLSTDLAADLVKRGVSPVAARKRISRSGGQVNHLPHLLFPHRARFIYLAEDFQTPAYWKALRKIILTKSPAYSSALAAIIQRNNIIPREHFAIACGSPIAQKKHIAASAIYERFLKAEIIREEDVPGIGICMFAFGESASTLNISELKARLITERILLFAVRDWVRRLGLASYEKVATRETTALPKVGTFGWDLTGPSYLGPMVDWIGSKLKPGFIACDVLLETLDENGISPFVKKCTTLRALKRVGRCLHLFVAERYTNSALRHAKRVGIIAATPESLFGIEVAQGLKKLTEVLTQAAFTAVNPDDFAKLFKNLEKIEGAASTLRGAVFELLAADLARKLEKGNVSSNEIICDVETNKKAEIDVLIVNDDQEVVFIECKGNLPTVQLGHDVVKHWLTNRIPLIRKIASEHPKWKKLPLRFELWTTGVLLSESLTMLTKAKNETKKYKIRFKRIKELQAYVLPIKKSATVKMLEQHFFNHPLSTVGKKVVKKPITNQSADQPHA